MSSNGRRRSQGRRASIAIPSDGPGSPAVVETPLSESLSKKADVFEQIKEINSRISHTEAYTSKLSHESERWDAELQKHQRTIEDNNVSNLTGASHRLDTKVRARYLLDQTVTAFKLQITAANEELSHSKKSEELETCRKSLVAETAKERTFDQLVQSVEAKKKEEREIANNLFTQMAQQSNSAISRMCRIIDSNDVFL